MNHIATICVIEVYLVPQNSWEDNAFIQVCVRKGLTTNGMFTVLTMSTSGLPADFSGTNTKLFGFRA